MCWPNNQNGKGHNVFPFIGGDGKYYIIASDTRPGDIFQAASLDGPWTQLGTLSSSGNFGQTANICIMYRPDGRYMAVPRSGVIALSNNNVLGTYVVQGTSAYSQAGVPSGNLEDPVVWYSGGLYHIVVNKWDTRKAYHITSTDGITGWKLSPGLAYDPTANFIRYTDGTVNHWNKLERFNVYMENDHVVAGIVAAIDVAKDADLGNDQHGSKVIIIPFDGAALDGESEPTITPTPGPTPVPLQDPVWSGGPYSLNGTTDYVDLPDGLTNDLNDFSIACWVNLSSLDTWSRIFDFGGDTNIFMMLTPASGNTGYPYFCITLTGNDGEQGLNGNSALPTGSWQHIAVTGSGDTGILYINTQETDRNTGMTIHPADMGNTVNNYIGRSQWTNDPYLNGEVNEFVVYNRAISAQEVAALGSVSPGETPVPSPDPTPAGTLGDVNDDGSIDIVDALLIAQYYVGLDPANFVPGNADTNCDGNIDIVDALLVAQYYVGLLSQFC
ncbi:MAG: hypothetical protein JXB88_06420 [Spirochaetales bacterium]|nr:hypothetical protein [Spirochaetales bacterium]